MFDLRLLIGALISLIAFAVIGFQLIGGNAEVAALARGEAPRIELSVMEKPLPAQQHIKVPVWIAPPSAELAVHLIPFLDTENDTKMEIAAVTVAKPKALPPMIATADVEGDTRTDPLFVAAVTAPRVAPQPAVIAKAELVKVDSAKPSAPEAEPRAILAKLNEADLEPTGSISLPKSIETPQPRVVPEPARPAARQPAVQRYAARPASPPPATPQPLPTQPYPPQAQQQTPQAQPNPLAVLFPPFPAAQPAANNAARPQPQPQPLFGTPAPASAPAPVKYPPFDRTAVGVLNPCCTPRAVIGGGE
jgi:hypothetical protein